MKTLSYVMWVYTKLLSMMRDEQGIKQKQKKSDLIRGEWSSLQGWGQKKDRKDDDLGSHFREFLKQFFNLFIIGHSKNG